MTKNVNNQKIRDIVRKAKLGVGTAIDEYKNNIIETLITEQSTDATHSDKSDLSEFITFLHERDKFVSAKFDEKILPVIQSLCYELASDTIGPKEKIKHMLRDQAILQHHIAHIIAIECSKKENTMLIKYLMTLIRNVRIAEFGEEEIVISDGEKDFSLNIDNILTGALSHGLVDYLVHTEKNIHFLHISESNINDYDIYHGTDVVFLDDNVLLQTNKEMLPIILFDVKTGLYDTPMKITNVQPISVDEMRFYNRLKRNAIYSSKKYKWYDKMLQHVNGQETYFNAYKATIHVGISQEALLGDDMQATVGESKKHFQEQLEHLEEQLIHHRNMMKTPLKSLKK